MLIGRRARQRLPGGLTKASMEASGAGADRQQILQFMTTAHFTLQTARGVANAEISARLQLYLGTLSSSIIALALTAQLSGVGRCVPGVRAGAAPGGVLPGVVTHGRLLQVNAEWRLDGQGMNRIRHYFLELARRWNPTSCCRPATTRGSPWPRSASRAGATLGGRRC
jgi:hypothetical protein